MTWLMPSTSMPRAAMSVATSVRTLAGAERCQHALALVLRLVAVDRLGGDAGLGQRADDLVGAALGAGEDQHALDRLLAAALPRAAPGLPARSTWITRCCDALDGGRRGVTATRTGSRSIWLARSAISRGMVAEKNSVWRLLGSLVDDPADVVDEAHVEHAVGFVEHEDFDAIEMNGAALHRGRAVVRASRPARRRRCVSARIWRSDGDAADGERDLQAQIAAVGAGSCRRSGRRARASGLSTSTRQAARLRPSAGWRRGD